LLSMATFVGATVTFTATPSTLTFTQATNSAEITITNTGNETASFTIPQDIKVSDGTSEAVITLDKYTFSLGNGTSTIISTSINPSDIDKLPLGVYSTNAEIKSENSAKTENSTQTLTFKVHKSYCEKGPLNLSVIEIRDVEESGSSSDDDWTWYPQDTITLGVKVKNNDDDNDRTVRVGWDIYDTSNDEFLDIGDEDTLDIDTNDEETVEFTFDVPYDLERGSTYLLYVKAYDDDDGEDEICSVSNENMRSAAIGEEEGIPIEIQRERNDVQITKTNLPELLSCSSTTDVGLWISNLGRDREDKIKVTLLESVFSKEASREISKLDWDDKAEEISFPIAVQEDLQEGIYKLKFKIEYDYDQDDDKYGIFSTTEYSIEVKGNCIEKEKEKSASITAELGSDAIAGQQLIIAGTIENKGKTETTYSLSATDYTSWATLDKIEPKTITLEAGKSKDFSIYFNVNEDAADEQLFKIKASYGGETTEQEVSVIVEGKKAASGGVSGITGATITEHLRENWFIWVIVVINIVLIIAIIVVARRIVASR